MHGAVRPQRTLKQVTHTSPALVLVSSTMFSLNVYLGQVYTGSDKDAESGQVFVQCDSNSADNVNDEDHPRRDDGDTTGHEENCGNISRPSTRNKDPSTRLPCRKMIQGDADSRQPTLSDDDGNAHNESVNNADDADNSGQHSTGSLVEVVSAGTEARQLSHRVHYATGGASRGQPARGRGENPSARGRSQVWLHGESGGTHG